MINSVEQGYIDEHEVLVERGRDIQVRISGVLSTRDAAEAQRLIEEIEQIQVDIASTWSSASTFPQTADRFSQLMNSFTMLANLRKPKLEEIIRSSSGTPIGSETTSVTLERIRLLPLRSMLKDWFTKDLNPTGEERLALEQALGEKLAALETVFVDYGHSIGRGETESRELWKNFKEICEEVYGLIFFGIMRSDSCNIAQLTAKHDKILEFADIPGAMALNSKFNLNPIVGAIDVDQGSQWSARAGLIQKICYAVFQEMCKPLGSGVVDGQSNQSGFSRNNGFRSSTVSDLVEMVAGLEQMSIIDSPRPIHLGIRSDLEQFPPELREVLLMIAVFKASRDDLGSKAGIWHLGKNKGAFKYSDGANGRPAGLLSSIMYQVGKNSSRDNHAAALYFIDPTETELASGKDDKDKEVIRFSEELNQFRVWSHPGWKSTSFDKYVPEHWYEDFPAIDEFFNQTNEAVMASDYKTSRDAVLKIIEMAASSTDTNLSTISTQLTEKVTVLVKAFNSEVGKALSYIGPHSVNSEYAYVHSLILAAFEFYLSNILAAVPGNIGVASNLFGNLANREYSELYQLTLNTIDGVISRNSTLAIFYHPKLVGLSKNGFIYQNGLRRTWRDEHKLRNTFQKWRLKNSPELQQISYFNKNEILNTPPHTPVNVREGWKPSYEDTFSQKT